MTETEYREICHELLGILQKFAPTGKEQHKCSEEYNNLVKELGYSRELVRSLVGTIYDGVAYGNWPWLKETKVSK